MRTRDMKIEDEKMIGSQDNAGVEEPNRGEGRRAGTPTYAFGDGY